MNSFISSVPMLCGDLLSRCPNHGTGDVVAKTHCIRVALFLVVVVLVSSCAIVVMVTYSDDLMLIRYRGDVWEYAVINAFPSLSLKGRFWRHI